jgi:hypothetical protein
MNLECYLKQIYNLPDNKKDLTLLDIIIIYSDFDKYQKALKYLIKYNNQKSFELSKKELFIIELETDPLRYIMYLLSQNYFNNYYNDLYFTLKSIYTNCDIDEINLDNENLLNKIYEKIDQIPNITTHIINIYEQIKNKTYPHADKYDLKLFYTDISIEKFINSLHTGKPDLSKFKYLSFENKSKIDKIYNVVIESSNNLIKYLNSFDKLKIFKSTEKYGLSNFDPKLYLYYLKYIIGLDFKDVSKIDYIYNWAKIYLKYSNQLIHQTLTKLYPLSKSKSIKSLIKIINCDPKYAFESEEDLINLYKQSMTNTSNIITQYNIPNKNKCNFITISDPNQSHASYSNNYISLNIFNWKDQKKYECRTLMMHECYPGHHMQQDISLNFTKNNYLMCIYSNIFTSFIEGWGLFSESIHSDNDLASNFGQLDADLLRILRIIVDIDLHYYGKSPDDTIKYMAKYLAIDISNIKSEVYRYLSIPAQAQTYKLGESVFMGIYYKIKSNYKNMGKSDLKINDPIMFDIYKKILVDGETTLEILLSNYGLELYN